MGGEAFGEHKLVVLEGVSGCVNPGEVMAIMGGSGAGKTTLLDILAGKSKTGTVAGDILVNGKKIKHDDYRSIIGYVDQEDTLMDTLTVYETILYSALLRLPRSMSLDHKKLRVEETLMELDIVHIANRRIGRAGSRGISGGEKRRVSIACELALTTIERTYHRTVIFTIHQPRSNIYALFDKLVLLAKGKLVYSGPAQQTAIDHFSSLGFTCPMGFNIADYLVDLTMHAVGSSGTPAEAAEPFPEAPLQPALVDEALEGSELPRSTPYTRRRRSSIRTQQEELLFTPRPHVGQSSSSSLIVSVSPGGDPLHQHDADDPEASSNTAPPRDGPPLLAPTASKSSPSIQPGEAPAAATGRKKMASTTPRGKRRRNLTNLFGSSDQPAIDENPTLGLPIADSFDGDHFRILTQGYAQSPVCATIRAEIDAAVTVAREAESSPTTLRGRRNRSFSSMASLRESITESRALNRLSGWLGNMGKERPTAWTQFTLLSGRTFKNLLRNPDLLRTHYVISVVVAGLCGALFFNVKNDIGGFQNRMGLFFFICALFGFGCLSSMQVFAAERLIFVRERANRYYQPITYFLSKVLFDMVPLRVVPPIILGLICYHMIGLRSDSVDFLLRLLLVLILFNLTAAACCMMLSIIFKDAGMASLIATLVMLFEMLFGGLLLNKGTVPVYLRWLQSLSFFNCALEALVVNEVNGLTLYEQKFGLQIDVPGAVILQTFGFNAKGYWQDVLRLTGMFFIFLG
ncbi:hypothetical protein HK101_005054, partial [Irineochytrium annulatum]